MIILTQVSHGQDDLRSIKQSVVRPINQRTILINYSTTSSSVLLCNNLFCMKIYVSIMLRERPI